MINRLLSKIPAIAFVSFATGLAVVLLASPMQQLERVASPMAIPGRRWPAILYRTYQEIIADRVLAVAAGVSFYSLLAVFPAITVFVSIYGLFTDQTSVVDHISMLSTLLPSGAMTIISDQLTRIATGSGTSLGLALVFGLLMAVWSANAGTKAVIEALNIAYDVKEQRSFVMLNLWALVLTLGGLLTLIALIGALGVIPVLLDYVLVSGLTDWVLWVGRWPFIYGLMLLGLAVLYQFGPNRPGVKWRWITPGSAVASAALLVFTLLFSWYAANFGSYNETYGSLGAVIVLLTWMWLSATIIIIGAELNSEIEAEANRHHDRVQRH